MKTTLASCWKFSFMAVVLAGLVFMTSCNKDEETVDPLVGNYKLSSSTYLGLFNPADGSTAPVATAVLVPNPAPPPTTLPFPISVNADVTAFVAGVLNGIPECTDASATTIEFRADGSLWFSCNGDGAAQSGTWAKDDTARTITLTISPTPNIPTGLTILMTNFTITSTTVAGTIVGFPLPLDVTMDLGATNLQLITTDATLARQS